MMISYVGREFELRRHCNHFLPAGSLGSFITPLENVGPIETRKTAQPILSSIVADLDSGDPLCQVIVVISAQEDTQFPA